MVNLLQKISFLRFEKLNFPDFWDPLKLLRPSKKSEILNSWHLSKTLKTRHWMNLFKNIVMYLVSTGTLLPKWWQRWLRSIDKQVCIFLLLLVLSPLKTLPKFTNLRFLARKLENSIGPAQLLSPILFQPFEIAFCLPCTLRKIPYCISCNFSAFHLDKLRENKFTYLLQKSCMAWFHF